MDNDMSLAGNEGSVSDDENFISISSDDDADYDATINMVNEYLNNFSNANLEVGSSSTPMSKEQGYEDVYVSESSDDVVSFSAPAPLPPVQDYVGKGKQRADPIPENLNFSGGSRFDAQETQTPQIKDPEVVMPSSNNSSFFPNNITERTVALFPSQPPNFPDWIIRDIMIPCPLSETQRALISNLILDSKLIQYLSKVSDHENVEADSLIRTKIDNILRIIDHEPVEAINGCLFSGLSRSSEIKFSVEKLKMLQCILTQLRPLRLIIGIAASSDLSTDAMIRFMDKIGQNYSIINDESLKYKKKLYQEQEYLVSSFCVIFSTDFTNYHKNVLPKLDLVIAYDTSFKPNQHFYFSMENLSIPVLRLVTWDTLEHVLVYGMVHKCSFITDSSVGALKKILFYGMKPIYKQYRVTMGHDCNSFSYSQICDSIFSSAKSNEWDSLERRFGEFANVNIKKWLEDNKTMTGLTFESVWNYRKKGEITANTLAECNINLSDTSDDEIGITSKNSDIKQGVKRPIAEAGPSCPKKPRSDESEILPTLSQLNELLQEKDNLIKQLEELNNLNKQLEEKNSELNCGIIKMSQEIGQLRQQLMYSQQILNQSTTKVQEKSEKKNGNVISGDVIMSSPSSNIVSYQSHFTKIENFPEEFSCQLQNCNKRFDSEKKLLNHQRSGHFNNEVIILD